VNSHSLLACLLIAFTGVSWARSGTYSQPLDVNYCQILNGPSAFVGQHIRVRGIYDHGFELQIFKSPICCLRSEPKIGIHFNNEMGHPSERLLHKLDKHPGIAIVVFVGTLEKVSNVSSELPSGDRLQLNVEKIEKLEKFTGPGKRTPPPKWVPTNCETSADGNAKGNEGK